MHVAVIVTSCAFLSHTVLHPYCLRLDQERSSIQIHVKLVGKSEFDFSTGLHYDKTKGSLLDEYKTKLIPKFRIMQYSGDADP